MSIRLKYLRVANFIETHPVTVTTLAVLVFFT